MMDLSNYVMKPAGTLATCFFSIITPCASYVFFVEIPTLIHVELHAMYSEH